MSHPIVSLGKYWKLFPTTLKPQRWHYCIWSGVHGPYFTNKRFFGVKCPALAHVGRYLMYLLSLCCKLIGTVKQLLGLADQRAHASTLCVFGCM